MSSRTASNGWANVVVSASLLILGLDATCVSCRRVCAAFVAADRTVTFNSSKNASTTARMLRM
jgi:hypothetical protein